jgi:hypothetical protein
MPAAEAAMGANTKLEMRTSFFNIMTPVICKLASSRCRPKAHLKKRQQAVFRKEMMAEGVAF